MELSYTEVPGAHLDYTMVSVKVQSIWHITKVFIVSKAVLFLILYFQTSEYDTSSALLFPNNGRNINSNSSFNFFRNVLAKRLFIWDTVFHVTAAMRPGLPVYEHEWAFGLGWSWVIRQAALILMKLFGSSRNTEDVVYYYVAASTIVSTLSHYLACLALYFLTLVIYSKPKSPYLVSLLEQARPQGGRSQEIPVVAAAPVSVSGTESAAEKQQEQQRKEAAEERYKQQERDQKKALLTAERIARKTGSLYALTPAGIFMVAGYSEPLFALLSFVGMLLREHQKYAIAGLFFGAATILRSNGLLWGLLYLGDLSLILNGLLKTFNTKFPPQRKQSGPSLRGKFLVAGVQVIIGGLLIGAAFFGFQYLAYTVYCPGAGSSSSDAEGMLRAPVWCNNRIPLIYSYVQSKYWGMGFLHYWTPNNIPNFLFAFPTLAIMWKSGCYYSYYLPNYIKTHTIVPEVGDYERRVLRKIEYLSPYLVVQGIMFFSCLATWHVQIITRVGSCLPVLYWYTAEMLMSTQLTQVKTGKIILRYFMVWIVVQGIFFSAFLPPA